MIQDISATKNTKQRFSINWDKTKWLSMVSWIQSLWTGKIFLWLSEVLIIVSMRPRYPYNSMQSNSIPLMLSACTYYGISLYYQNNINIRIIKKGILNLLRRNNINQIPNVYSKSFAYKLLYLWCIFWRYSSLSLSLKFILVTFGLTISDPFLWLNYDNELDLWFLIYLLLWIIFTYFGLFLLFIICCIFLLFVSIYLLELQVFICLSLLNFSSLFYALGLIWELVS